ncbi:MULTISPECIES: asparaginase [Brucella/Ochrobactrum group]|uniref:asparaginase n=1 Tax=Brucella/Ochrobactrum group TaxID=2826938 RepID=UPI001C04173D|nr:asparaginase [Brucella sp. NBRC 12950]QWK79565.1 asparaginase [Ochrobactrum sp. BTU1]GLU26133.1 L-asparaginase [Brucella sp. NBRC 12950]
MNNSQFKPLVAVIATGGTIASKRGDDGASTPTLNGDDLLATLGEVGAKLRPIDLMAKDSSSLTLIDMQSISEAIEAQIADPQISGVVVLHGTDAMEETALLVQLQRNHSKPVIFTGAQFTADHPNADGPSNLKTAIDLAADPANAQQGVLIAFGGRIVPAWGAFKFSSDHADAFRSVRELERPEAGRLPASVSGTRVDIVAIHPGCDDLHLQASIQAGSHGIVLAALGSGNANATIVQAVKQCAQNNIPVVVSSRVPTGMLAPGYGGGGGGHDLVAAGAVHSQTLRPGQARILLASLIASKSPKAAIIQAFDDRNP